MEPFERPCSCRECGRAYVVRGASINPTNETQVMTEFICSCGSTVTAHVPGSVNLEKIQVQAATDPTRP
jgi:hypothetical protein